MKTCPKCGAENRQTASECRLCATPLESPGDLLEVRQDTGFSAELPPDRIVSGHEPSTPHRPDPASSSPNRCSNCNALNEPGWAFCQHCGTRRTGAERPAQTLDPTGGPAQKALSSLGAPFVAGSLAEPKSESASVRKGSGEGGAGVTATGGPAVARPPSSGPKTARTCPNCGVLVPPGLIYCANCGRTVSTEHEADEAAVTKPGSAAGLVDIPVSVESRVAIPVPKPQPGRAVIQMITEGGQVGDVYEIRQGELKIGRVEGDVKFPHDGYMSGQHARVVERAGRFFLIDEDSRNGTFIRITDEVELKPGDTFLVGKQVFKFGTENEEGPAR